jgi:hypothetical protein
MALAAKLTEETRAPSVWVSCQHSTTPDKIETYHHFAVQWRGETVEADVSGDRYTYSGGEWSPWRFIVQRTSPHVSDTARAAIREAVTPACAAFVEGDEWAPAYRQALARMIARAIRDEGSRYGVERCRTQLARHADDLDADDLARLTEAIDALARCVELVEAITGA